MVQAVIKMLPRLTTRAVMALIAGLCIVGHGQAQTYPDRPVTLTVPFAPAGGTDTAAGVIAPILSSKLGATVVIENMGGACGEHRGRPLREMVGSRSSHVDRDAALLTAGSAPSRIERAFVLSERYTRILQETRPASVSSMLRARHSNS